MQDALNAPPFKKLNWLKRDIELLKRADGSMILRSRVPLQAFPTHIPSLLHKWADERPGHTWLAQRRGPDGAWLQLSYAQARQTVDALTQALLDLGAGPQRPVAITMVRASAFGWPEVDLKAA